MKAVWVGLCLLALMLLAPLFKTVTAQTEEVQKEAITVKSSTQNSEVIIITGRGASNAIELQCTKSFASCTALKPGEYLMVRLPKNRGTYECANVKVYDKSADPESADELGIYCITDK